VKLAVPAYFGPWERHHWASLLNARPAVVVINPASGPGPEPQGGYGPLVEQLRRNGTTVLGYVTTSWLARSVAECAAEVRTYLDAYGTTGVLYDEVPPDLAALEQLYQLAQPAVAGSASVVVFNPGRQIPQEFRDALPTVSWVTFEGTGRQYLERHGGTHPPVASPTDWHLVHSVPPSSWARVLRTLHRNAPTHAYVTADRMPNPWDVFDPSGIAGTK
jgi:Spherulation-specific family 4